MTMSMRAAVILLSLAVMSGRAVSLGITQPMTFEALDSGEVVARGQLTNQTADAFEHFLSKHPLAPGDTIYLLSFGGDLDAGMALGTIIRAHGLNAEIGSPEELPPFETLFPDGTINAINTMEAYRPSATPAFDALMKSLGQKPVSSLSNIGRTFFPGYCLSACAYTYLGGVKRTMIAGSRYGLHQFDGNCATAEECLKSSQQQFGKVLAYVQKMGADPALLAAAATAAPDSFNFVPDEDLERFRILYTAGTESWNLAQDDEGRTSLVGEFREPSKAQTVTFKCSTSQPGSLALMIDFALPTTFVSSGEIEQGLSKMAWQTSELPTPPYLNKWGDQGHAFGANGNARLAADEKRIAWGMDAAVELTNALAKGAKSFVVGATVGIGQWPVEVAGAAPGALVVQRFLKSCRPT